MNREFHIAAMAEYVRRPAVGILADPRAFIMRGNVLDLAVAFMMGVAFHNVKDTFIQGIITPAILKPALDAVRGQFQIHFLGNRNATFGYGNIYMGTNSHTLHVHDSNVTRQRKPQ